MNDHKKMRVFVAALLGGLLLSTSISEARSTPVTAKQPAAHAKKKQCKGTKKAKCKAKGRQAPGQKLAEVPAAQAAAFSVLAGPAATFVPAIVARHADAEDKFTASLGLDASQTRRMTVGSDVMYVMPGSKGLCLSISAGMGTCARTEDAVKSGLSFLSVPPASGKVNPAGGPAFGPGTTTWYGLAPDGVTDITGLTGTGKTVAARQNGNAYVMRAETFIVSATLNRPGQTPLTVP